MMAWLLDEFGDRDNVRQAIERNIHTFGWSGSMTTYYEHYRQPLTDRLQHRKSRCDVGPDSPARKEEDLVGARRYAG